MKSKNMAKGGLFTALSFIFLYLASYLPTNKLAFLVLASVMIPFTVVLCDLRTSFIVYGATCLLSLIIPNKIIFITYALLFGLYGIIKYIAENRKNRVYEYIIKFSFLNISMIICYIIYINLFTSTQQTKIIYLYFIAAQPLFLLYDFIMTQCISYFSKKLKNVN